MTKFRISVGVLVSILAFGVATPFALATHEVSMAPTTNAPTALTLTTATMSGTNGDTLATDEAFWYGDSAVAANFFTASAAPGGQLPVGWTGVFATTEDLLAGGSFSEGLSGLTPDTTYYYVAWSLVGGTWYPGDVVSFTTASVTTNAESLVTSTDATLNGTNGVEDAVGHSFWASLATFSTASPSLPSGVFSTPDLGTIAASTPFSALLSATGITVTPGTQYFFAAWSNIGGTWYPGSVNDFTTLSQQTISVTTSAPTNAVYGDTFSVAADSLDSITTVNTGLTVTITTNSACTYSAGVVTITSSGPTDCEVHYNQAGNSSYDPATEIVENVTLSKRPITITAQANSKVYDGGVTSATASTITVGTLATSTADVATLTQTYDDKNVGTGKTLTPAVTIVDGSLTDVTAHYDITPVTAVTGTITKKTLNVTPASPDRVYNGSATTTVTFTDDRLLGDVFTISGTAHFNTKHVDAGKVVTVDTVVKSGIDSGNYTLAVSGTLVLADVTPLSITVTALTNSKQYDATTTASAVPTLSVPLAWSDTAVISESYDTKAVGAGKTLTPAIVINDGNNGANYAITLVSDTTGEITEKPLTITGVSVASKVYDKDYPATLVFTSPTLVGVVSGDVVTPVTGSATAAFTDYNVGTGKAVTVSGITLTGADATNYTLTQPTGVTGTITVRPITVVATFNSKVYDRLLTATAVPTIATGTLATANGGDTATLTEAYLTKVVGTANKTVVPTAVITDGNSGNNYSVTLVNNTTSTITERPLAVTATGVNKVYDGTTVASVLFADDRLGGDVLSITGTANFTDKHVGTTKTVNVTGISVTGTDAANYSANTTTSTTADITTRPITVTAVTNTKVYNASTTAAAIPLLSVNTIATGDSAVMSETYDNANVAGSPTKVMTPAIVITDGNSGNNYAVTLVTSATGIITVAPVTVSFTASNKTYDATTTASVATRSVTGAISPDVVTATGGVAVFADKNVGTAKTVTAGGFALDNANYSVTSVASTTANITAKPLTVTATGVNKVYDATTTASVVFADNRISGDVFNPITGTANFVTKTVGIEKTVNVTGILLTGTDAGNYSANTTTSTMANITSRSLTATVSAADKVFDNTTTATVTFSNNAVAGDVVTHTATSADFDTATVGTGKTVTALGIASGGADATNYTLAATTATTTASITAVPSSGGGGGGGVACAAGTSFNFTTFTCTPVPTQTTGSNGQVLGATTFNFTKNLFFRITNATADVIELQKLLIAKGYSIPAGATGFFGAQTLSAVKVFQKDHGIPQTGFVGPLTRAELNKGI